MGARGVAAAGVDTGPPEATVFKSLALDLLTRGLEAPGKHHILDFGPPVGENVKFFSRFRCCLHIDELFGAVRVRNGRSVDRADDPAPAFDSSSFRLPPVTSLDVVLLWDLFDYLPADFATRVVSMLREPCRSGSLLYLLVSTRARIPPMPGRFRIFDTSHVAYEPAGSALRAGPGYTPRRLERMMPGVELLHSFLAGNGMQEYLFTFK